MFFLLDEFFLIIWGIQWIVILSIGLVIGRRFWKVILMHFIIQAVLINVGYYWELWRSPSWEDLRFEFFSLIAAIIHSLIITVFYSVKQNRLDVEET